MEAVITALAISINPGPGVRDPNLHTPHALSSMDATLFRDQISLDDDAMVVTYERNDDDIWLVAVPFPGRPGRSRSNL